MSATTWVGFVGTALVITAYLPQLVHLIKERCSWGISLGAYALWFVAGILIFAHALSLNDSVFIVLQGYNVAATATIAAFAKKYKAEYLHRPSAVGSCRRVAISLSRRLTDARHLARRAKLGASLSHPV